jgi:glyoxylase-like metal-dependent hydrolase (beta-lactamase superfamily II)
VAAQSPLRDYLTSLQLIRALPDARLLPAHGPATTSTHARIDTLVEHHEERLSVTAEVVTKGASTAFEAANVITWTRHRRAFGDLDMFNQIMAVHETMAHLEVLVERGVLTRSVADGIVGFAPA